MLSWEELEQRCMECQSCILYEKRTNMVFGVGNRQSKVLFVGEGPGEQEDLQGEPFVGRAGKLLDDMLALIHLNRKNVYIANIVKCRPPQNRDPRTEEQEACMPWLENQIALLAPKIIVCLGRISAMKLIKPDFKITKEHGVWFPKKNCQMMALYHPAALLRDPRRRPETFEDLKRLEAKIQQLCPEMFSAKEK